MKKYISSVLFLLWFFISIGLSFYFGEEEKTSILVLVTIGQIFFIMGLIAVIDSIKKKEKVFWILLFPIIGLGMIIAGLGIYFHINIIIKYYILLIPIGMVTIGALVLLGSLLKYAKRDRTCTEKINAKIVGVFEENSTGEDKLPVYEFYYNNQLYLVSNAKYQSEIKKEEIKKEEQEKEKELLINPNNPYIFEDEEKDISIIAILLEELPFVICIIVGIIMLYIFSKYFI